MSASAPVPRANGTAPVERFFRFSVLGLVASGYLAVAGSGYLDIISAAAVGAAILARTFSEAGWIRLRLPEPWITALTVAYLGFYALDYLYLSDDFLTATVHLILFLAVMKILSGAQERDYVFLVVIAFLELLAASLLSSRINFFGFLALFLVFAVATFASWEIRRSIGRAGAVARRSQAAVQIRLAGVAACVTVGILAITAGLFFFLPRTARAAFQHLVPERYHLTGFSDEVTLGQIGEVKQQSAVLMHVRIPELERPLHLKWRGMALAEFDGRRWFNSREGGQLLRVEQTLLRLADDDQRRRLGERLDYEVQLKSIASDVLFIAGRPEFIRIRSPFLIRTATGSFRDAYRASATVRYGVYAFLEETARDKDPAVAPLTPGERELYLRMPPVDPRIAELAWQVSRGYGSSVGKALAIEQHLRTRYGYTIELPRRPPPDPIAHFLFERRRGHCEYFASAMAVMLRAVGIPSRVVTGFQSGVFNPLTGWWVIRASDAHSWVEAWLPETGWTTFDPTPPDPSPPALGLWSRLGLVLDAAETFWQEWVLNYDLDRQLTLAARVERSGRNFSFDWLSHPSAAWRWIKESAGPWARRYGPAAVAVLFLTVVLVPGSRSLRRWWEARQQALRMQRGEALCSDATRLYTRALDLLRRHGIEKPPWLTPVEFTRTITSPRLAPVVDSLTAAYNRLRFGGDPQAAPRMLALLDELEQALRRS